MPEIVRPTARHYVILRDQESGNTVTVTGNRLDINSSVVESFGFNAAIGALPGITRSNASWLGVSTNIGNDAGGLPDPTFFSDVWGTTGNMVYPTGPEQWEVVSTSASDTAAGTGTRQLLVEYMDYTTRQYTSEFVTMNGTTPVLLASSNAWRPEQMVGIFAGSGKTNAGDIILRVSGGGATRDYMPAGAGVTSNGRYTVPDGYTWLLAGTRAQVGKDADVQINIKAALDYETYNHEFDFGNFNIYQNQIVSEFADVFDVIPARTEIRAQARASNGDTRVQVYSFGYLVDNSVYTIS